MGREDRVRGTVNGSTTRLEIENFWRVKRDEWCRSLKRFTRRRELIGVLKDSATGRLTLPSTKSVCWRRWASDDVPSILGRCSCKNCQRPFTYRIPGFWRHPVGVVVEYTMRRNHGCAACNAIWMTAFEATLWFYKRLREIKCVGFPSLIIWHLEFHQQTGNHIKFIVARLLSSHTYASDRRH